MSGIRGNGGFTLVEVLVAFLILTMMVTVVANLFSQVSDAWNIGIQGAQVNNVGRAALDLMANELSQAVAGKIISSGTNTSGTNINFEWATNSVKFLCFSPEVKQNARAYRCVHYSIEDDPDASGFKVLMRTLWTESFDPFSGELPTSGGSKQRVMENVLDMRLAAYDGASPSPWNPPSPLDHLPQFLDIYVEVMAPDARQTYATISGEAADSFRQRNAHVFSTRVYFPNRGGLSQ